jgi:hypothetical protein
LPTAARALDRVDDIDAAGEQDRSDAAEPGRDRDANERVGEHAEVRADVYRARHVRKGRGQVGNQRLGQPQGKDRSRHATGHRQQPALGQQLQADALP